MATLGFTTYIQPAPPTPPTLEERFSELTGAEKFAVLNGFENKILANRLKAIIGLPKDLIHGIYLAIDLIEEYSRSLMRGEILITEGEYDPDTGEEITPPVYNTPPASLDELKAELVTQSTGVIFNEAEIGIVVDTMITYSEIDKYGLPIGTLAVYAANVIL